VSGTENGFLNVITCLSILCTLFESVIKAVIQSNMHDNDVLAEEKKGWIRMLRGARIKLDAHKPCGYHHDKESASLSDLNFQAC
jgi:hypothetical protein